MTTMLGSFLVFIAIALFRVDSDAHVSAMECALLGAGMLLRLATCVFETQRLRTDATPHPEILSQAIVPMVALAGTAPLLIAASNLLEHAFGVELSRSAHMGLAVLLYFLLAMGLSLLGLRNVRTLLRELKTFAAQDREQLRERVRRVNGAGIGD